jgi:hypothetical protein
VYVYVCVCVYCICARGYSAVNTLFVSQRACICLWCVFLPVCCLLFWTVMVADDPSLATVTTGKAAQVHASVCSVCKCVHNFNSCMQGTVHFHEYRRSNPCLHFDACIAGDHVSPRLRAKANPSVRTCVWAPRFMNVGRQGRYVPAHIFLFQHLVFHILF